MKTRLFNSIRWFCALLFLAGSANYLLSNNLNSKWGGVDPLSETCYFDEGTIALTIQFDISKLKPVPYCDEFELSVTVTNLSEIPVTLDEVTILSPSDHLFPVDLGDFDENIGDPDPCSATPSNLSFKVRKAQVTTPAYQTVVFTCTARFTTPCSGQHIGTVDLLAEYVYNNKSCYIKTDISPERTVVLDGTDAPLLLSEVWNPLLYNGAHQNYDALLIRGELVVDYFDPQAGQAQLGQLGPGLIQFNDFMSRILMDEGAKMTIDEDVSLTIRKAGTQQSVSIDGCNTMWNTIDVKGRLELGNAFVRDAQHGITLRDGSTINLHNVDFIDNYVGVYVPPKEASAKYGEFNSIFRESFTDLRFFSTKDFLPAYDGQEFIPQGTGFAGIEAYQLKTFNLSGFYEPGVTDLRNRYFGLANGIVLHQSSAVVGDSYFYDLLELENTPYPFSGRAISIDKALLQSDPPTPTSLPNMVPPTLVKGWGDDHGPMFENCSYGIHVVDADLNMNQVFMQELTHAVYFSEGLHRYLQMRNNHIQSDLHGLWGQSNVGGIATIQDNIFQTIGTDDSIEGQAFMLNDIGMPSIRWHVKNNLFSMQRFGYGAVMQNSHLARFHQNEFHTLGYNEQEAEAIRLLSGSGNQIYCNNFVGRDDYSVQNIKDEAAICIDMSSGTYLACNNFQKMRHAIVFDKMNSQTSVQGNIFESYYRALLLQEQANIGTQVHHGNTWYDMDTDLQQVQWFGAQHLSTSPQLITQSRFIVDDSDTPEFMPKWTTGVGNNVTWFEPEEDDFNLTFFCSEGPTCEDDNIGVSFIWDELEERLYEDSLIAASYHQQQTWIGRKQLFRHLQANPALWTGHAAATGFYNFMQQESPGKFVNAEEALRSRISFNTTQQEALEGLLEAMTEGLERLHRADSILYTQGNTPNAAVLALRAATLDSLELWMGQKEDLYDALFHGLQDDLNDLKTGLALLPDTENIELSHLLVQEILIDLLLNGSMQPDSAQTETLTLVALQCPLDGGESVYAARSLLGWGYISTDSLCTDGQLAKALPNAKGALSLQPPYPNPADTEVWVSLPAAEGTMQLIVVNAQGQLQWQQSVQGSEQPQPVRIATGNWAPGVYYILLQLPNGQRMQQRVSIVH
jgi:hypothetical protein